jgi:hypothetical protein
MVRESLAPAKKSNTEAILVEDPNLVEEEEVVLIKHDRHAL